MHKRGELKTFGRTTLDVSEFLKFVQQELEGSAVHRAGADRYRNAELQDAMRKARLPWRMDWRGTGTHKFAQGSQDVRAAQRAIMDKRVKSLDLLTLRSAIRESELRGEGAGNPALEKSRQRGRIDALQALVIAAGLAEADSALGMRGIPQAVLPVDIGRMRTHIMKTTIELADSLFEQARAFASPRRRS